MTPHSEALEPVLRLAAQGWRLLPCAERGKAALLKDWPRRASCDPRVISAWAEKHEGCNWAVACGPESGIWVLDVDGEPGSASLASLIQTHGEDWAKTLTAATARGRHFYFTYPPTGTVRCSTGKLGAGLDVRGAGGYVLVPPSTHPSGARYEWITPLNGLPPASSPARLLELVTSAERSVVQAAEIGIIPEGRRNDTLTRVGGYLRRKGATAPEITTELLEQNFRRCRPPLSESEVRTIAGSVSRYEPGGPDPLESAWQAIQGETHPSNYERFLALARQLQLVRPDQTIALPLERIGALMGVHWTAVGLYRRRAVTAALLQPSGQYVAHRRAALFRFSPGATLTKSLTTGLVRVCDNDGPIVRRDSSSIVRTHSKSEDFQSELKFQGAVGYELVAQIGHLYPGNKHLFGKPLPYSLETAILNAARRDGRKVLSATIAFAAAVKEWPAEAY